MYEAGDSQGLHCRLGNQTVDEIYDVFGEFLLMGILERVLNVSRTTTTRRIIMNLTIKSE
jgi:hypothetical protein